MFSNIKITSDNKIIELGKKCIRNMEYTELFNNKGNNRKLIKLYHGSPNKVIKLEYGKGEDKHDYGRGFYLTRNIELAKEWSVCNGNNVGYVHCYTLDITDLRVLDFNKLSELTWMAELMSHRPADNSARYRKLAPIFIKKLKKI